MDKFMKKEKEKKQKNIIQKICTICAIFILIINCFIQIKENDMISKSKQVYKDIDIALETETGSNIKNYWNLIKKGEFDTIEKLIQPVLNE